MPEAERDSEIVSSLLLDDTIDSNSDGIRDDVERYIEQNYSNATNELNLARKFVRSVNRYAVSTTTQGAELAALDFQEAIECIYQFLPENAASSRASEMVSNLEKATFNTKDRVLAYYSTDNLLVKNIYEEINPSESDCTGGGL
jgi:hypothetical protein